MRIVTVLSVSAVFLLTGCTSFKPSILTVGSVGTLLPPPPAIGGAPANIAPAPTNIATAPAETAPTGGFNVQRPVDCAEYVIDIDDACY
jgi:hypothetical protein